MSHITIQPVFDHSARANVSRMPVWIRQALGDQQYGDTARAISQHALHTVCEEARCPNRGECWSQGTATVMLLGDTCTRACGFCAVKTGKPAALAEDEPQRVANAVQQMGLNYVVITSVNRDDVADGGARIFARSIEYIRANNPQIGLELLTPDFHRCQSEAIEIISRGLQQAQGNARMVWGHNIETVPRLYREVRKGSDYQRSLQLLQQVAQQPGMQTKSALMLGLGENEEEVVEVLNDLYQSGVRRLALGQYLRPTRYHLPVQAYITPEKFAEYAQRAEQIGFTWIKSGPLVRSSYHAED